MDICPLCNEAAKVIPPSWSGGIFKVNCKSCGGEYFTNKITIDELETLKAKNHPRVKEIIDSIPLIGEYRLITKSQRYETIIFEQHPKPTETKQTRKMRQKFRRRDADKPKKLEINIVKLEEYDKE